MKIAFDVHGCLVVEGEDATEWLALRTWADRWREDTAALVVATMKPGNTILNRTMLEPDEQHLFCTVLPEEGEEDETDDDDDEEVDKETLVTRKQYTNALSLILGGLRVEGAHHKQYYLDRALAVLVPPDEYHQHKNSAGWGDGIMP